MEVFTYPGLFKFFFRFGNIPITILLLIYLIPSVVFVDKNLILIVPLLVSAFLIYFLNKQFIILYKILPYKIQYDNGKLICSDFIFSAREIVINIEDIEALKGGIFEGKLRGLQRIYDGKNQIIIGYFNKIKNSQKLGTIILSKVKRKVYDDVINNIKPAGLKKK